MERPLQARLVASELGEGVRLLGVGIERTSEQDLVPVSLVRRALERFARFRMRGFVGEMGGCQTPSRFRRSPHRSGPQFSAGPP